MRIENVMSGYCSTQHLYVITLCSAPISVTAYIAFNSLTSLADFWSPCQYVDNLFLRYSTLLIYHEWIQAKFNRATTWSLIARMLIKIKHFGSAWPWLYSNYKHNEIERLNFKNVVWILWIKYINNTCSQLCDFVLCALIFWRSRL